MAQNNPIKLSDLQLELMDVLWHLGEASTSEIHETFGAPRELAYTTVATLLKRLDEKGVVGHRRDGRQFVYHPKLARDSVQQTMVSGLVKRLFRGDPAELVSHLLGDETVDDDDIARIQSLLDQHHGASS